MTIELDPLSLVYNGIVDAILADDFVKSLHDRQSIFLDFLPNTPNTTTATIPVRNMPRMSLMQDTVVWGTNNSCTGKIDFAVNIKIIGFGTRSVEFNPLVFHLLKITRPGRLDGTLRLIQFQEKPLQTISRGGNASYEYDEERQIWACTIPIEIQIYM
jgi:hypothetical protein